MSFIEAMIGEIRMFAGVYAPLGWRFCDGRVLNINEFQALYSLLGTTYGGDGKNTFALPDLRGRVPIHPGQGKGLTSHRLGASGGKEKTEPKKAQVILAGPDAGDTVAVAHSEPIEHMQPFLCINFIICVDGVYPPREQ